MEVSGGEWHTQRLPGGGILLCIGKWTQEGEVHHGVSSLLYDLSYFWLFMIRVESAAFFVSQLCIVYCSYVGTCYAIAEGSKLYCGDDLCTLAYEGLDCNYRSAVSRQVLVTYCIIAKGSKLYCVDDLWMLAYEGLDCKYSSAVSMQMLVTYCVVAEGSKLYWVDELCTLAYEGLDCNYWSGVSTKVLVTYNVVVKGSKLYCFDVETCTE